VQAGTLQFRIGFDFALSSAILVVDETDRKKDVPVTQPIPASSPPNIPAPLADIYSIPMQNMDPITSEAEIRIYNTEDPNNHILMIGTFHAELVMNNRATAL
jgi:hypothetical protein